MSFRYFENTDDLPAGCQPRPVALSAANPASVVAVWPHTGQGNNYFDRSEDGPVAGLRSSKSAASLARARSADHWSAVQASYGLGASCRFTIDTIIIGNA